MNTTRTRTRRSAAILFSGILVFGGLALTGEASAIKNVDDNPTCEYLGYEYGARWQGPTEGYYTVNRDGMVASLRVGTYDDVEVPNSNNAVLSYSISTAAAGYAVVVKGGDGATVYRSGSLVTPMHAPAVSSGKWPTISHLDLCWNKPAPEPELGTLQVTKEVTGDAPATHQYEICIAGVDPLDPVATKECTTITGPGMVTFTNLELGTYRVTETDPEMTNPGSDYEVTIDPETVLVASEIPATAKVTNSYTPEIPDVPETPEVPEVPEVPEATEVEVLPPIAPATPAAPATPTTEVAAQTTLPATGSEGGLAAIAAILVTTGVGLTLLGKRRATQQA